MVISIIIAAKNEEKTIGDVIDACKNSLKDFDKEIIVVVADSKDSSIEICEEKNVMVVVQNHKGKGNAMSCGFRKSKGDVIVYTDADIKNMTPEMIEKVVDPILNGEYDFVKGSYSNIGRVTEFTVRPLLRFTFPEIKDIGQPLSGQIAGRRNFFEKIEFVEDWGVDIGILIDTAMLGARIKDVELREKEDVYKHHLEQEHFIEEIVATILRKAKKYQRVDKLKEINISLLLEKTLNIVKKLRLET